MTHSSQPSPLEARRSPPLAGRVRVPGDKSISLRSLILGAMAVGETRITGMLEGEDAISTANAMKALGATVERTGERAWRLPIGASYSEIIKSDIADIKNTGGRYGGASNAAAFLEQFGGDYPWVHMDIAGTAWTDQKPKAYAPKGATGVGVRLLIQALRTWPEAHR